MKMLLVFLMANGLLLSAVGFAAMLQNTDSQSYELQNRPNTLADGLMLVFQRPDITEET